MADEKDSKSGGESTLTVLVAMAANAGIGVLKLVAAIFTGSAAMYAEAAHSVADTVTEGLLLTALRRSGRKPDREHPFGYGKERFFWALIAAVSIFVSGAVFAAYEGVRTILGESEEQTLAWVAYAVLGVSFLLEGASWLQAVRQLRNEARRDETTPLNWLRQTDDPTVKTVFFEDSAALIGLLLAFAGVGLHQLTGSAFWDGLASVLIAVLLTAVAYILGGTNKGLLVGRQADRRTVYELRDALAERPEVEQVVDLLTMMIGTDQILCVPGSTSTTPWTRRRSSGPARDRRGPARALPGRRRDLRRAGPAHRPGDPGAGAGPLRAGGRGAPADGAAPTGLIGRAAGVCSMVALLQSHCSKATLLQSRLHAPRARPHTAGPSASSAYATSGRSVGSIGRGSTSRPVR